MEDDKTVPVGVASFTYIHDPDVFDSRPSPLKFGVLPPVLASQQNIRTYVDAGVQLYQPPTPLGSISGDTNPLGGMGTKYLDQDIFKKFEKAIDDKNRAEEELKADKEPDRNLVILSRLLTGSSKIDLEEMIGRVEELLSTEEDYNDD